MTARVRIRGLGQANGWIGTALFGAAGLALVVARRPEAVLAAEPWAESAPVYYLPTFYYDPITLLGQPYAGYLPVANRLIAEVEAMAVPSMAPSVATVITIAVTVGVAGFLAGPRMAPMLPFRWQRFAFAFALLSAPAVYEILGVDVSLHFYLATYLTAIAVASPPGTTFGRMIDVVGTAISGLTGPFSILLLPVFAVKRHWLTPVIATCAVVQFAFIAFTANRQVEGIGLADIGAVASLRINVAFMGAVLGPLAPSVLSILLTLGLAVILARSGAWRVWWPFGYAAAAIAAAGIAVTGPSINGSVADGERYFLVLSLSVALAVILGVNAVERGAKVPARTLGVMLVCGYVLSFRVPAFQDGTWQQRSSCVGSDVPCLVHVHPDRFSVWWPGNHGRYVLPIAWPAN